MTELCVITLRDMADDNLLKERFEEVHALRSAVLGVAAAVLGMQVLDSTDFSKPSCRLAARPDGLGRVVMPPGVSRS